MSLPESATAANASAAGLGAFIDASPSPYHVCATAAAQLRASGFTELLAGQSWPGTPGRYFVQRGGGSLVAWATSAPGAPFRVIAAHTDSPNLRVKQQPDMVSAGVGLVALEPYGGAWLNSWLDRDLGLSGRLALRDGNSVRQHIFRIDEPILRVPQLAIHLSDDRKAIGLDPQRHLNAIWNTRPTGKTFADLLSQQLGIPAAEILAWDAMTHDLVPSAITGIEADLLSAPRLDNQATCYAGLHALRTVAAQDNPYTPVLALFDHEEVGSQSQRGADSDLLPVTLERIDLSQGGSRADFLARLANSVCLSGDMAHATHPNYPDRHEPGHHISLGGGPVIKVNQNLRYATDALSAAVFVAACEQAGVPFQRYTHRADLPCGSTVGPMVAAGTGMSTVDVGAPQLAMHSARELMSAHDVEPYAAALTAFLAPA